MTPERYALVEAAGQAILHFLWQGLLVASLLELVLAGMRRRSADERYLVRCLALLVMAAAPFATFALVLDPAGSAGPGDVALRAGEGLPPWASAPWLWIVATWSLGATVLSARLAGGWARVRSLRFRTRGAHLPARWQRTFDRIARELGVRAVARAVDSAIVGVPTMIGWLRPVVLIPARVLTGLSEEQIEAVLAHELAHVRRCDYLVNVLQSVVEALLFYHPAVWRVSSGIRSEREFCCDDVALSITGDGVSYARALTELESWRTAGVGVGVSTLGGSLMHRIQRLVGIKTESAAAPRRIVHALGALLAAGTIGATALGLSHEPSTAPQDGEVHVNVARPVEVRLHDVFENRVHPVTVNVRSLVQGDEEEAGSLQADERELMELIERIHDKLHAVREHAVRIHELGGSLHARPQDDSHEVHVEHEVENVELHPDVVKRLHGRLGSGGELHGHIVENLRGHLKNLDVERLELAPEVIERLQDRLQNLHLDELKLETGKLDGKLLDKLHNRLQLLDLDKVKINAQKLDNEVLDKLKDRLENLDLDEVMVETRKLDGKLLEKLHNHLEHLDLDEVKIHAGELDSEVLEKLQDRLEHLDLDKVKVKNGKLDGKLLEKLQNRLKLLELDDEGDSHVIELPALDVLKNHVLKLHDEGSDQGAIRLEILDRIKRQLPELKAEIRRLEIEIPKIEIQELEIPKIEIEEMKVPKEKPHRIELVRRDVEPGSERARSRTLAPRVY